MQLTERILNSIKSGKLAFKDVNAICAAAGLPKKAKGRVLDAIDTLVKNGDVICERGLYGTPEQWGAFCGTVRGNARGFAFITPDGKDKFDGDFFVPKRNLHGALDMDKVIAVPVRGTEDEARVIKIVKRGRRVVVGVFEKDRHAGYVLPDKESYDSDVYIPLSLCGNAKRGDKVVAEITSYPAGKMVGGKIIEILGEDGDFDTEELGIIRGYELKEEFPAEVERAAEEVAKQPVLLDGRRDLRNLLTVTIDGEDTRDIDDAVSLEKTANGYRLGVHIADVSHYVKFKSALDNEAFARGTSVYFPDRVLPMLPRALSNGACSLNEGENRFALSCFMEFDGAGKRVNSDICESVICSDRRMTYNEVTAILQGGRTDGNDPAICAMLKDMEELTLLLEKRRESLGSVTLDVKEAHIYLDERGEIVIPDFNRSISHRLIEQFMVAANEAVAEYLLKRKAPCLYRVHEKPAPEKAEIFFSFLNDLGVRAKENTEDITPKDFQRILAGVSDKPYSSVVNKVMLRSMQKARYCEENLGHFGLASQCYCHFTSPIRRYPDLFVHRSLKEYLHGNGDRAEKLYGAIAAESAKQASERERRADLAERDVDELYKVVYMSERIGEEYDAVISGVISSGIFAELPNTIEGMIRLENLPPDAYEYYEGKFLLKGKRHSFRIGDCIKVKVAACDYGSMRVQFALV